MLTAARLIAASVGDGDAGAGLDWCAAAAAAAGHSRLADDISLAKAGLLLSAGDHRAAAAVLQASSSSETLRSAV